MLDLGPHANFIIAAYGVAFVAIGALALTTFADDRKQRRLLAEMERQGIRRRSATKPHAAKAHATKATTKTTKPRTAKKPKPAAAKAKRRPAKARARKTPS